MQAPNPRIEAKEEKFINLFQGQSLYFIIKEEKRSYTIVSIVHKPEDFQIVYKLKGTYHLFKSSIFGQYIEWVESFYSSINKCDIPLELDEKSWATLARMSLEKNMTVNEAIVALLKVYTKGGCMSRTKRNIPEAMLTEKEKKLAKRNKYHHPVQIKSSGYEDEFSQNAKREAKKEKHRKQRRETNKEIKDQISEE